MESFLTQFLTSAPHEGGDKEGMVCVDWAPRVPHHRGITLGHAEEMGAVEQKITFFISYPAIFGPFLGRVRVPSDVAQPKHREMRGSSVVGGKSTQSWARATITWLLQAPAGAG